MNLKTKYEKVNKAIKLLSEAGYTFTNSSAYYELFNLRQTLLNQIKEAINRSNDHLEE